MPIKRGKLMTDAGFPVQKSGNGWSCPSFPVDQGAASLTTQPKATRRSRNSFRRSGSKIWGSPSRSRTWSFRTFLPMTEQGRLRRLCPPRMGRRLYGPVHVSRVSIIRRLTRAAPVGGTRNTIRCLTTLTTRSTSRSRYRKARPGRILYLAAADRDPARHERHELDEKTLRKGNVSESGNSFPVEIRLHRT